MGAPHRIFEERNRGAGLMPPNPNVTSYSTCSVAPGWMYEPEESPLIVYSKREEEPLPKPEPPPEVEPPFEF
jgi:hypothetical protein